MTSKAKHSKARRDNAEARAARPAESFPARVAALMATRKWSQKALARETGIAQATLSDLLAGKTTPTVDSARRIATAFGVQLGELLDEAATAAGATANAVRMLTLEQLAPSPDNPAGRAVTYAAAKVAELHKAFAGDDTNATIAAALNLTADDVARFRALDELAESIAEAGLLQNLVVRPSTGDAGSPPFTIIAGHRRLAAMQMLVESGRRPADAPVPCLVLNPGESGEQRALALIENLQRTDLTPLEEADQFAALVALDPIAWETENIARRIGKTRRFVQQRLALTKLIEPAREAVRAGTVTVEQARALAQAPEGKQKKWLGRGAVPSADSIGHSIAGQMIPVSRAAFPIADYEAAGGAIVVAGDDADMPLPEGIASGTKLCADGKLFRKLQTKAARAKVKTLAGKWSWAEFSTGVVYDDQLKATENEKKAGALVWIDHSGAIKTKTGILKPADGRERGTSGRTAQRDKKAETEKAEREARIAAAERVEPLLREKLAADRGALLRLLLLATLGCGTVLDMNRADYYGANKDMPHSSPMRAALQKAAGEKDGNAANPAKAWKWAAKLDEAELLAGLAAFAADAFTLEEMRFAGRGVEHALGLVGELAKRVDMLLPPELGGPAVGEQLGLNAAEFGFCPHPKCRDATACAKACKCIDSIMPDAAAVAPPAHIETPAELRRPKKGPSLVERAAAANPALPLDEPARKAKESAA